MLASKLPPLSALEAFVAVAHQQSLKAAAPELNISVSALSRRIQTLEAHLGLALFERGARDFRLTREGAALLEGVSASFDLLRTSINDLRPVQRRLTLRIGAPPGFSGYWLAPRLARFKALQPAVDVAIDTARPSLSRLGAGVHALVMVAEDSSLQPSDRYVHQWLAPLRIRAVCSPEFLAAAGGTLSARDLDEQVLLAAHDHPQWVNQWLRAAGGGPAPQRVDYFASTPVLLEAAASGLGVALVSELMAENHLDQGRLVDPFGVCADTPASYWIVTRTADLASPGLQRFTGWLTDSLAEAFGRAVAMA